jgi:hypothetical protein
MIMELKLIIVFLSMLLISCAQVPEKNAEVKINKAPQPNHLRLLQGPWEDIHHRVYYVEDTSYKVFEFRKCNTRQFELRGDTLNYFAMADREDTYRAIIINISKDSLILQTKLSGTRKFWRPSVETLKKDTVTLDIIRVDEKKIMGNNFVFRLLSDYEEHVFLQVYLKECKDSCERLVHDLYFRWGDCNITSTGLIVYEIKKDLLIMYSEVEDDEHMDNRYPHYSTEYTKETYAIRKSGEIIRLKTERGKKDSLIVKEVLEKQTELKWRKD